MRHLCRNCRSSTLRSPRGRGATVNLSTEEASVVYNPSITTLDEMKRAIEEAGYKFLGVAGQTPLEAEEELRKRDLEDKAVRFSLGFAVSIPEFIAMLVSPSSFMHQLSLAMLVVTTPVFAYVAYPIFRAAVTALRNRILSMDVMYAMGTGVALHRQCGCHLRPGTVP